MPVIPTSVSVGSGTGSVSTTGVVTFAGASSVMLNGIFNSTYRNYRIVCQINSATHELRQRYSIGGTAQTSALYGWAGIRTTSAGTSSIYSGSGLDWSALGVMQAATSQEFIFDITNPAISGPITRLNASLGFWNGQWEAVNFSAAYNSGTAVDGFQIYGTTGTMTDGTFRVFGYRD